MRINSHSVLALGIGLLVASLAGCGGSSSDDSDEPTGALQVFHAASDAPAVDIIVNGQETLTDVSFGSASGFLSVTTNPDITVEIADSGAEVFSGPVTLEEDERRTVVARGLNDAGSQLDVDIIDEPADKPSSGETRIRAYHASAAAPDAVDVYVGDPSIDAQTLVNNNSPTVAALNRGDSTGFLSRSVGDIRIVLTAAGDDQIAYNSGRVSTVGGENITVAAIDGSRSVSPVATVALTGTNEPGPAVEWQDARPGVRLAHLSPDAGPVTVDLSWDGTNTSVNANYKDVTDYITFSEDVDTLDASVAGINTSVPLKDNNGDPRDLTVAVIGLASGGSPSLQFAPLSDNLSPTPATKADFRVVHAATDNLLSASSGVDLYVNPAGTSDSDFAIDPLLSQPGITFGDVTAYFRAPAANYRVDVTQAGVTSSAALTVDPFTLNSRDRVTVFAIGDPNNGKTVELFPVAN